MTEALKSIFTEYLWHDSYTIFAIELILIVILLYFVSKDMYALYKSRQPGARLGVSRGDKSVEKFHLAYAMASGVLVVIVQSATFLEDRMAFIHVVNVAILFYLFYWNSCFRNLIIRTYYRIKDLEK